MAKAHSTRTNPADQKRSKAEPDPAELSGDLQGLPADELENESVRDLAEEGQFREAELADSVENAPPADKGPLRVHQRREDDLRPEYADRPNDEPTEE